MNQFSIGAEESVKDYRTVVSTKVSPPSNTIPSVGSVDFSKIPLSNLYDQFQIGECTQCATDKAAESDLEVLDNFGHTWGYLICKVYIDGNLTEGSSALSALKGANKFGIPKKVVCDKYPLQVNGSYAQLIVDFQQTYGGKIPQEVLDSAALNKISGYYSVPVDPLSIANEINKGNPVIIRLTVGDNTYRDVNGNVSYSSKDLLPLRAPKTIEGGHLLCCNGYNGIDYNQLLSGPNSWGTRWCPETGGYYDFIFKTQQPYFTEAWAITQLSPQVVYNINNMPPVNTGWPVWFQKFYVGMFKAGFVMIDGKFIWSKKSPTPTTGS